MNKVNYIKSLGSLLLILFTLMGNAQLSVNTLSTTYTIDFASTFSGINNSSYTAAGAQSTPASGQLDSDGWAATGWSDGALTFGGTRTTAATDYTRGATAIAIATGGFYAFTGAPHSAANPAFLIQPGGSDWAPGTLTLRILNNSGSAITSFDISYDLFVRNDQGRASSFNFSYSTDNTTYTPVAALDYTSIEVADALGYVQVGSAPSRSTTIGSISIADGTYFYIRWNGADVSGSGSRDEFALDNIKITGNSSCSLSSEPATHSSGITFSDIGCNAMTLTWAAGNGANRIVVAKSGSAVAGTPTDQTTYTANGTFGSGSTIAAGEFVIYKGTGTTVTCLGLTASTTYYFKVFEYNGNSCEENYLISGSPLSGNQASIACSECPRLTGALINSCQGTCMEGDNELLFLTSGSYSIPVSAANIVVKYEAASPATITYTDALTTNATFINTLNTTAGCGTLFYDAMAIGRIPPNTEFIVMRSTACYGYDFSTFCSSGPIYVVFSSDASWTTGGNFSNSCAPLRYFRTDFTGFAAGCVIDYSYDPCLLTVGGDGDAVTWPLAGGAADNYFNDGCQPSVTILPIELLDFSAKPTGNDVEISWITASETDNDFFTIERSSDATDFEPFATINGAGNSGSMRTYKLIDHQPFSGTNYYRLKQTDFDGQLTYSRIISVNMGASLGSNIFPNPATDKLNIHLSGRSGLAILEVINLQGVILLKKVIDDAEEQNLSVDLQEISSGTYILKTTSGNNTEQALFIKQ